MKIKKILTYTLKIVLLLLIIFLIGYLIYAFKFV